MLTARQVLNATIRTASGIGEPQRSVHPTRPKTPITLNQIIRLIASLGGFLGRKSDGEPDPKTLWIGVQRTIDAASTIRALREDDA
ncbi:IS4 family transposase [Caballeronia sordidicola]|uniref:IS4 family transposase n=1 Tax=Caballeronia sordidicola TaxID=196367 RepID=UPI00359471E1